MPHTCQIAVGPICQQWNSGGPKHRPHICQQQQVSLSAEVAIAEPRGPTHPLPYARQQHTGPSTCSGGASRPCVSLSFLQQQRETQTWQLLAFHLKAEEDPAQVSPSPPPSDPRWIQGQKVNQTQNLPNLYLVAEGSPCRCFPTTSSTSRDRMESSLVPKDQRTYQEKYFPSCRSGILHPHLMTSGSPGKHLSSLQATPAGFQLEHMQN